MLTDWPGRTDIAASFHPSSSCFLDKSLMLVIVFQPVSAGPLQSVVADAKSATDSVGSADISADQSSVTTTATDLFSVHDFDVNISMDITPGITLTSEFQFLKHTFFTLPPRSELIFFMLLLL